MRKIFPNVLSNKTCNPIISLTHQVVALAALTTVTGLTEEVTLDINSLIPNFSLTNLIKLCLSQSGHDGSRVFTVSLGNAQFFPEQLCQVYLLGHSCRLSKLE